MFKEEDIYLTPLKDYTSHLLKEALKSKERWEKSQGTHEEPFYRGQQIGFYKIVDTLYDQAVVLSESLDVPLEKMGLDKINPERDIL